MIKQGVVIPLGEHPTSQQIQNAYRALYLLGYDVPYLVPPDDADALYTHLKNRQNMGLDFYP
jgi:hypothetical protein